MRLKSRRNLGAGLFAAVACLAVMSSVQVRAHGGGTWEPFTIDGVNNNARIEVSKVHTLMAAVIRGRSGADDWPVDGLQEMRDALLTIKEVVDEVLEHYVIDGVDVQSKSLPHVKSPDPTRSTRESGWASNSPEHSR